MTPITKVAVTWLKLQLTSGPSKESQLSPNVAPLYQSVKFTRHPPARKQTKTYMLPSQGLPLNSREALPFEDRIKRVISRVSSQVLYGYSLVL